MRIQVVEYSAGIHLETVSKNVNKINEIYCGVQKANKKISTALRTRREPLQISEGRLKAAGIAGVIQLTDDLEIEIVPKILDSNMQNSWQETLYLLAVLSKHGSILASENISSSTSYANSLYEIAGQILAKEYLKCRRKLIRQYRKEHFRDYSIDGEIELSDVFDHHPDGIEQSKVRFDKRNKFNATIKEAMTILFPLVKDLQIKKILLLAISELGIQDVPPKHKLLVPPRNKEWQPMYDLSFDIVRGFGALYEEGRFFAPGFIVDTWRLWEWLITTGLRIGNTSKTVASQKPVLWGNKSTNSGSYNINVFPDIEVLSKNDPKEPLYLVDAKYKPIKNSKTGEIERDDLYEAFSFCNATNVRQIVLVYPATTTTEVPGTVKRSAIYHIKNVKVYIVQVSFGAIREKGGIYTFSKNLTTGIDSVLRT